MTKVCHVLRELEAENVGKCMQVVHIHSLNQIFFISSSIQYNIIQFLESKMRNCVVERSKEEQNCMVT